MIKITNNLIIRFTETLRMHSPVLVSIKLPNKSYTLPRQYTDDPKYPETVEIDANTATIIPTYSIH